MSMSSSHIPKAIIANRTISVAIALATASLAGIFTSTATDMGVEVFRFCSTVKLSTEAGLKGDFRPIPTSIAQVHLF